MIRFTMKDIKGNSWEMIAEELPKIGEKIILEITGEAFKVKNILRFFNPLHSGFQESKIIIHVVSN